MLRKYVLLIIACCLTLVGSAQNHKYTLVIDAGHGGHDPGAVYKKLKEKNINLTIALAFGKLVEQNCPDVKVIYTRKTDVFIPLYQRANIANKNKADVFISIHTNSAKNYATGFETYTMGVRRSDEKLSAAMRENEVVLQESDYQKHYAGFDPRSPESYIIFDLLNETNMAESVELAQLIQRHACAEAKRPNRGVKQDAFLVLRETSMPACLIEVGYINHEQIVLSNSATLQAMAKGIYQAFVAFKNKKTGGQKAQKEEQKVEEQKQEQQSEQKQQEQKQQEQKQQSEQKQEQQSSAKPATPADNKAAATSDPVFKVQFLASSKKLKAGDSQLKGLAGYECYQENGMWKYTIGESTDYNVILKLRKEVQKKFPQAFIIAFKNGVKTDAAAAYQEYKQKRNKNK